MKTAGTEVVKVCLPGLPGQMARDASGQRGRAVQLTNLHANRETLRIAPASEGQSRPDASRVRASHPLHRDRSRTASAAKD